MNIDKENMGFWTLTLFNEHTSKEEVLNIACDKRYKAKDIKRVMAEAHPEYTNMKARRAKKPKVWKAR